MHMNILLLVAYSNQTYWHKVMGNLKSKALDDMSTESLYELMRTLGTEYESCAKMVRLTGINGGTNSS